MVDGGPRLLISYDVDTRTVNVATHFGIPAAAAAGDARMAALYGTYEEGSGRRRPHESQGEPRGEGNKAYLDHM